MRLIRKSSDPSSEAEKFSRDPDRDPLVEGPLREIVEALSFPRHFVAEPEANRRAGEIVADGLREAGLEVVFDGPWRNVVGLPADRSRPLLLVGAHYDSVPRSPGADDNASAVAAMLRAARIVGPEASVLWVAFNREEDDLLGSTDLVARGLARLGVEIRAAHTLEMLGYTSDTQQLPPGLPVAAPQDGRFLGLLSKGAGNREVRRLVSLAEAHVPALAVTGLQIWCGLDRLFPDLYRSDHAPFWRAGIPAVMWTDTAEFRNPHYHRPTDLPDTLDYRHLARVTALLVAALS